jgi:hypothetical protein
VTRIVRPELLDSLPPESPAAIRSRRDLARINRVMGNLAWFARAVPPRILPGETALELGAGDGALALHLRASGLAVDALDRFPAPPAWPASALWHVADLRGFAAWSGYPVVLANLVLHHLDDDELADLGGRLDRHARLLVFNEPLRRFRCRLLWEFAAPLGGAGPVTRHDGRVSIAAGFRGDELPRALRLPPARWTWHLTETPVGGSRLVATRRP